MRSGDHAYPAMLGAIDAAEKSVGLCSYIFRDDEAGLPFKLIWWLSRGSFDRLERRAFAYAGLA